MAILLTHAAWWDRLTTEDHDLLHRLAEPHGALLAWLERDLSEHGPRPWAAIRAALGGDAALSAALAQTAASDDGDDSAEFSDLRRLLDGRLLDALKAEQPALALAAGADPQAREAYQRSFERMRQLKQRSGSTDRP